MFEINPATTGVDAEVPDKRNSFPAMITGYLVPANEISGYALPAALYPGYGSLAVPVTVAK